VLQAVTAYGVAVLADIADYFRMPATALKPRIGELVASGRLEQLTVEGWKAPAYAIPDTSAPNQVDACALLAPFDPLIWYRPRLERLFDFEYRFEIFVPDEQRRWGTYVLPFLLGDRMVARIDVKADRERRVLLAPAAYLEPDADPESTAASLAGELKSLVEWLGLKRIVVGRRGNLAALLRKALR
jgi:uncharacterized protein YcaQ